MTKGDILFKMWNEKNNFNPPLSIQEILDFYETDYIEEECDLFPLSEFMTKSYQKETVDNGINVKYNTKKDILQVIKEYNKNIEHLMEKKRNSDTKIEAHYYELIIEERVKRRDQLKKTLNYVGVKLSNNDLITAKQRPITDYIDFKGGFVKCLWHSEKTASMKYYSKNNKVHCFGGCGSKDVIDVVQQIHNCDLSKAIKIILCKN